MDLPLKTRMFFFPLTKLHFKIKVTNFLIIKNVYYNFLPTFSSRASLAYLPYISRESLRVSRTYLELYYPQPWVFDNTIRQ